MYRKIIFCFIFIISLYAQAYCKFDKLYVDGKLANIFLMVDFDEVYITGQDVENIFKRKDISFEEQTLSVVIAGKPIPSKIAMYENIPCYPLIAISKELGYPIKWDYAESRIDLSISSQGFSSISQTSADSKVRQNRKRKRRGLFIDLVSDEYIKDTSGSVTAVRVQTLVRNTFFREVPKAKAVCVFSYPNGSELYTDEIILEDLKSEEMRRVIFYCANPSSVLIPEYKFEVVELKELQE